MCVCVYAARVLRPPINRYLRVHSNRLDRYAQFPLTHSSLLMPWGWCTKTLPLVVPLSIEVGYDGGGGHGSGGECGGGLVTESITTRVILIPKKGEDEDRTNYRGGSVGRRNYTQSLIGIWLCKAAGTYICVERLIRLH